ncbi:MAG: hypothetical protein MMC33_000169 [Icmadophila ericetorum]|nr:hypothetical protein [Icmadophila ericetorum]
MASSWKVLPVATHLRALLYKYEIGVSSFTISVTDLTHVWVEERDRKQIIKKAWDVDASIDPSEGIDQLQLLLEKLQTALDGNEGTSLIVSSKISSSQNLDLEAAIPLPSPLPPLEWIFNLQSAPITELSTKFVEPCLEQLLYSKYQVVSLITHLKEKDHVMGKLLDKLQSAGIDMNAVFPNAPIRKGPKQFSRDFVGAAVKGLNVFNQEKWQNSIDSVFKPSLKEQDFLDCCSNPQAPLELYDRIFHNQSPPKDEILQSQSSEPTSHKPKESAGVVSESMTEISMEDQLDGAVEVADGSTTSEDDDLDNTSIPHKLLAHRSQESKPEMTSKRLGKIGRRERDMQSSQSSQSSKTEPAKTPDPTKPEPEPEPEQPELAKRSQGVPPKKKIGKIGGKALYTHSATQSTSHTDRALATTSKSQRRVVENSSSPVPSEDESCGRKGKERVEEKEAKMSGSPSPVKETSEERADRRRVELKRELEEKSKVPVKRKRKF